MDDTPSFDVLPSATDPNAPLVLNPRHRAQLTSAARFLEAFLVTRPDLRHSTEGEGVPDSRWGTADESVQLRGDLVCSAEELRYAAQAIGKISGNVDVEDVLDVIFRDFCIGK